MLVPEGDQFRSRVRRQSQRIGVEEVADGVAGGETEGVGDDGRDDGQIDQADELPGGQDEGDDEGHLHCREEQPGHDPDGDDPAPFRLLHIAQTGDDDRQRRDQDERIMADIASVVEHRR